MRCLQIALVTLVLASTVVGCRESRDTLRVTDRILLPHTRFESVYLRSAEEIWLGAPGELVRVDATGLEQVGIRLSDPGSPRFVAARDDRLYFQSGASVVLVDARSGEPLEAPGMPGHLALDVRGRYLFRTGDSGAVFAHHPETLEPLWGWPAVGAPASALALSPEGDRIYQAIGGEDAEAPPQLLVRDLQTGRILGKVALVETIRTLVAGRESSLFALSPGTSATGAVLRLSWRAETLEQVWRRSFADLRATAPTAMTLSPAGSRLAVLDAENGTGLLVLDVETGKISGHLRGEPLAAAFDPMDRVYLLYQGELRRLE